MPTSATSAGQRRSPRLDVRGRVVLITGAARGIGAATAEELVRRGARVFLAGLEPERLAEVADRLGPNAAWYEADVRSGEQVEAAVAHAIERFGGVDVAIANAGIAPTGLVHDFDAGAFEAIVGVNLVGVWRTLRATVPSVVERGGHLLTVSSLAAAVHLPLMSAYAATKAAVSALADSLRMELAGTGATVGCAYFSFVDTDMTRDALSTPEAEVVWGALARPRQLVRTMPVERAARGLADGIEARSRWIVRPRVSAGALVAPALVQRVAEIRARRSALAGRLRARSSVPLHPPT